ncbi:MAG: site-2 protease family protein [Patescibacteria group bacterium]
MVTTIIFLIVLTILVFIHELGHFLAARLFGIRVDEFAVGFPPRIWSRVVGKTRYAINLLPLGGYVRIFGEHPDDEVTSESIMSKPRWQQAVVLVAGVTFNIIFAWLLLSLALTIGSKTTTEGFPQSSIRDRSVVVDFVASDSPAAVAGMKPGDELVSVSNGTTTIATSSLTVVSVQNLIATSPKVGITYKENTETKSVEIVPLAGIVEGKQAIGISMSEIGTIRMNPFSALYYGAIQTYHLSVSVVVGLSHFIGNIFIGQADFKDVSGPVGIAGVVGEASRMGIAYLITITAIISVNLAAINLVPFPALDGGRLAVVAVEAVIRRPLKPSIINAVNVVGFIFLLLLMVLVTFKDVVKLFH